jgi:hypothetical protein
VPDRLLNKSPEKTEFSTNLTLGDGYANYHQTVALELLLRGPSAPLSTGSYCSFAIAVSFPDPLRRRCGSSVVIVPRQRGTYISHPPYIRRQRRSVRRFATERHRGCAWWRLHGQLGA